MARRTKKVGAAGRYGTRYGVTVRYREKNIISNLKRKSSCPKCRHISVSRIKSGIWRCRHCTYTFAAGAYTPATRKLAREE